MDLFDNFGTKGVTIILNSHGHYNMLFPHIMKVTMLHDKITLRINDMVILLLNRFCFFKSDHKV